MNTQEVCSILNIDKRTLQRYRDFGMIPFTKIENKYYYKKEEIKKVLEKGLSNDG